MPFEGLSLGGGHGGGIHGYLLTVHRDRCRVTIWAWSVVSFTGEATDRRFEKKVSSRLTSERGLYLFPLDFIPEAGNAIQC